MSVTAANEERRTDAHNYDQHPSGWHAR
jgi:hypothetical protein